MNTISIYEILNKIKYFHLKHFKGHPQYQMMLQGSRESDTLPKTTGEPTDEKQNVKGRFVWKS